MGISGGIKTSDVADREAIERFLQASSAAWNAGDLDGFLAVYEDAPETLLVGATAITHGGEQIRAMYGKSYPAHRRKELMGRMTFTDLEVRLLAADYAVAAGKWHIQRSDEHGGEEAGLFTLVLHRTAAGWRIAVDHTP